MLSAQPTQFKLSDDGQIFYQAVASNPLPGVAVATVRKGDAVLAPRIELLGDAAPVKAHDADTVLQALQTWLSAHIAGVLEPLVALKGDETLEGAVKDIADKVYDALGIVPREDIESSIAQLDQDARRMLRAKRVRLGPVLVFQPDLNKPAAVRLRGLLWSLFNDKPLPAPLPNDGVVSLKVDAATVDKSFQQVIGYPVYGPRAIRIDMLDRVINAIYDQAEGGKFKAKHEMAEWLGCSIESLYEVLSAMGHTLVYDPAPEQEEAKAKAKALAEQAALEAPDVVEAVDAPAAADKPKEEAKPQEQIKPELATFRLKKGKAFEKQEKPKFKKPDAKKPEKAKGKGKRNKTTHKEPKIMSAEAEKNFEDSPFAILQQLQTKKNG